MDKYIFNNYLSKDDSAFFGRSKSRTKDESEIYGVIDKVLVNAKLQHEWKEAKKRSQGY